MSRKAIFFDIDKTLWDEKFHIPDSTKEAFRLLHERGHLTFLCTGRTLCYLLDDRLMELGFDGIVAGCGTYVEGNGKEVFHNVIDKQLLADTLAILKPGGYPLVLEGRDHLYVDEEAFGEDPFLQVLHDAVADKIQPIWGNEDNICVSKLSMEIWGQDHKEVFDKLREHYEIIYHNMDFVEIVPKNHSKATGMARACEEFGIAHEDTYAFGDSMNDYDMICYAKHGIVMGDGMEQVKAVADYVTSELHKDGIYNGLKHYGLI